MTLTNHLISWMVYCYIQRKSRGVVTCVGGWIQLRFVCPQLSARDPSLHSSVCILIMSSFPSGRWTVISLCQSAWHRLDLKTYSLICGLSMLQQFPPGEFFFLKNDIKVNRKRWENQRPIMEKSKYYR